MKAGTPALFSLIVYHLVYTSAAQTNITADVGENVTLTCKVHNNNKRITTVEWSRPELDPEYVLRWQYGHLDPHNQHRSYKNRVYLQDKEMKDGDVSLILMNVMKNDTGTYHCRVFQENNEPICSINLEVVEPGDQEGRIGDGGEKDGGDKDGGDKDGGDKDGVDKDEGDKDGRDKDGGDKDGRDKDGGDKDGGDNDGRDKDGGDKDGGDNDGNIRDGVNKDGVNMDVLIGGLVAGVIVLAVLAVIGSLIYRRCMKKNPNLPVPTEEAAPIPMPTRSESAAEPTPPSAPLMDPAEEEETEM